MAVPVTSLALTEATFNAIAFLEQIQSIEIAAQNTLVRSKGIADDLDIKQITKQKQVINWEGHFLNNNLTSSPLIIESSNLSMHIWTLGGTDYLGELKSGTFDCTISGPEVSGIAVLNEFPIPTNRDLAITSDIMVVTQDALNYLNMTSATETGFLVSVSIGWAAGGSGIGEAVTFPGILSATSHKVTRDGVQMENCRIDLASGAAPTVKYNGTNETTSLLYLAILGAGACTFAVDTGANLYENASMQTAMMSKLNFRFQDKALITQQVTFEVQGAMAVTEGA